MRILLTLLVPALTFAQIQFSTLNKDYTEALKFTNHIRKYYGYSPLEYDLKLSLDAKKTAEAYLDNQSSVDGDNTLVYLIDKHQFTLKDSYLTDALVAWSVDTDLIFRKETFNQIINEKATRIGFSILEKNSLICVTAKIDK